MSSSLRRTLNLEDTIFALASGSLPCAVAILRLSGPGAFDFAHKYFRPASGSWLGKRGMSFGGLFNAAGQEIDSVVLLSFQAPHSFSGQNVIEIQCHGSLAVVAQIERLFVEEGFRPAERGEFSFRAFHNERMSAPALESLGDVFLAKDASDLDRIYRRKDASVEKEVQGVRDELIRLQAILDTAVDFSEEYASVVHSASQPLARAIEKCDAIASRYESFRQGARVPRLVLAGRPNAGKSSLFNALLCRYRAIVHASPGTTRDAIEEDIELGGKSWKLVDTAGLRTGETEAERLGIELGSNFLESAGFWILVVDGTQGLSDPERELLERFGQKPHLIVWNKKDLAGFEAPPIQEAMAISALSGESLLELSAVLHQRVSQLGVESTALPSSVQAKRLRMAVEELVTLREGLSGEVPPEVLGEKNRFVLRQLESVVGDVGVEEVLDRVFSEFCIGK